MSFADKIADLAAQATKGPWQVVCRRVNGATHFLVREHTHLSVAYDVEYWGGIRVPTMDRDGYLVRNEDCDICDTKAATAELIAHLNPVVALAVARALKAARKENERLKAFLSWAWNQPSSQVTFSIDDEVAINLDGASKEADAVLAALDAMEAP